MHETPWHHWPVAILALAWHLLGAADYLLAKLEYGPYLSAFTPDQIAWFAGLPLWIDIAWAVAVWVGLAGAWSLMRRGAQAALLLALALAGLIVLAAGLLLVAEPPLGAVAGAAGVYAILGAIAAEVLFFLYARAMHVAQRRA